MKLSKTFVLFAAIIAVAFLFQGCPQPPSINLCEKSASCFDPPAEGDWLCDEDGASAKITLIEMDADPDAEPVPLPPMLAMRVKGTAPTPDTTYMLIVYIDPWPGYGLTCLGSVTSDEDGLIEFDTAYVGPDLVDAKIWLVPIADVTCPILEPSYVPGYMTGWDCDNLMFEVAVEDLVNYDSPLDDPPPE